MRQAEGGPFDSERRLPPEVERRLNEKFDLDQPGWIQFARYLGDLLPLDFNVTAERLPDPEPAREADAAPEPAPRWGPAHWEWRGFDAPDLGPSMKYKDKDVADIIAEGFPTSAVLGVSAIFIALMVGVSLGVLAALRQNRTQDYAVMAFALVGVCLPPLVMGPILSLLFGVELKWLPAGGLARDQFSIPHLFLPVLTLSLPQIAIVSRLTRASMIEALRSNAIRTARAKGLPEVQVVLRHALPIALLPIVSYLGPAMAGVLTGSFVIEQVFQLPGVGRQFVIGALQRDYTLVMGVVILFAGLIILLNLAADLLYRVLDPRVRHAS
ncbi:MAG: ABC transporter permease subunit [Alphaproteobacteria bacterium]|nr:ABC transporter permease subunit [Alphaproteobacteria bacterium]